MSYSPVEVFKIGKIERIPGADKIGLTKLHDFIFVVGLADYKEGDLVAYIEPDSVVPENSTFNFLWANNKKALAERAFACQIPEKYRRIKVKRFKGVLSQGLVIPAPPGAKEGDDVGELLGITHWNPPELEGGNSERPPRAKGGRPKTLKSWAKFLTFKVLRALGITHPKLLGGLQEDGPEMDLPIYDIENFHRYADVFKPGEIVIATEKVDGANARYLFHNGRMWCGSHRQWKAKGDNAWWHALRQHKWAEDFCRSHPDHCLYGELYGPGIRTTKGTGPKPYGVMSNKDIGFAPFDIRYNGKWLDFDDAVSLILRFTDTIDTERWLGPLWAPVVYHGPYDKALLLELAEKPSFLWPSQAIMEGIVIRPKHERYQSPIGRVILKAKSKAYLERE
jgi:hypothetical protein